MADLDPEQDALRHHLARWLLGLSPSGRAVPAERRRESYRKLCRNKPALMADVSARMRRMRETRQ